jgi:twitching motility two-component system response regulator PilG
MSRFIVVIDDSLTVRKILETCLRRAGYEVKSFPDGVEALRWLIKPEACIPALVLVDLGLPKLDGYDLIRLLKARPAFERAVLVIISRRDGVLDRIKGRLAGAHAYVTKPFTTRTIIALVQGHLRVAAVSEAAVQSSTSLLNAHEHQGDETSFQREEQCRDRAAAAIPRAR